MINQYKLLVVDIDGTLVDKGHAVSSENKKALAKVSNLGIQVSLSTGRAMKACTDVLRQLSLDGYHIFFDGALITNPDCKEVYVRFLSQALVKQAIEFAHLNGLDLDLYSIADYFVERETWSAMAHRQFFNLEPIMVDFNKLWREEKIIKIGLVATSIQEGDKVRKFCSHFNDSCHFSWARTPAYPDSAFINVVASGVSKGKALEALVSHLGINTSEVMAIGDGINDVSLLSTSGLSIAMGNAPDEVKASADYITLDVAHSGLAAAIDKFLF